MGLDMYLLGVETKFDQHDYNIGMVRTMTEIGYWRKANAIHKWFVDNVQDGIDDCKNYFVDPSQLEELKELCQEVLNNPKKAKELLPTESGFFFGPTEYDEWYFSDLRDTIEIIDWALDQNFCYFSYESSW